MPDAHIRIFWLISNEILSVLQTSRLRDKKTEVFFSQLFRNIFHSRIIVGYDKHRLARDKQIGNDIQNRLCFSCARRTLDNAHLVCQCRFYGSFLTGIATEWIICRCGQLICAQLSFVAKILRERNIVTLYIYLFILLGKNILVFFSCQSGFSGQFLKILPV